jgi:uncharacterized RDD family membrane protein YckC
MTPPYVYAGFWRRGGAYLADAVLAFSLLFPYTYLLEQLLRPQFGSAKLLYGISEFLLSDAIVMALVVIFWVKRGATPGMMLLELHVIDATSGQRLSWKQAIARLFMRMLAILTIVGIVMLVWDRQKQGLHDKVCHTLVVDANEDYEYLDYPANGAGV